MTEKAKAADDLMAAIQRRAMEIVELPQVDREARYDFYRRAYKDSAHGVGMADAEGMSQQMDEWVRALVAIIESGGGAGGGKA